MVLDNLALGQREIKYALFSMGSMCAILELEFSPGQPHFKIEERGAISDRVDVVAMAVKGAFRVTKEEKGISQTEPIIVDYEEVPDLVSGVFGYYRGMLRCYPNEHLDEIRRGINPNQSMREIPYDPRLN